MTANGTRKKRGVLDRVRDVGRVGGLDRVQHQRRCEHPVQPDDRRPVGRGSASRLVARATVVGRGPLAGQLRVREADQAGGDHQIQRDQQVRRLAAELHRHAQRQDREHG